MKTAGWPRPRELKCWRGEQKEPGCTAGVALLPLGCGEGTLGCAWPWVQHACAPACPQWLPWPVLPERAYLTSRWESTKEAWKWAQWSQAFSFPPFKGWKYQGRCHKSICFGRERGKETLWAGWGPEDLCWPQPGWCCAQEESKVCVWGWWASSEHWGGLKVLQGEGKDTPAAGIIWGPGLCPAVLQGIPFHTPGCVCASPCVCVFVCVCVGIGVEEKKKATIQLNNLLGINLHLPGFFCPAGQRNALRDEQRKIPSLQAGKHTGFFAWKFLGTPQFVFVSLY